MQKTQGTRPKFFHLVRVAKSIKVLPHTGIAHCAVTEDSKARILSRWSKKAAKTLIKHGSQHGHRNWTHAEFHRVTQTVVPGARTSLTYPALYLARLGCWLGDPTPSATMACSRTFLVLVPPDGVGVGVGQGGSGWPGIPSGYSQAGGCVAELWHSI